MSANRQMYSSKQAQVFNDLKLQKCVSNFAVGVSWRDVFRNLDALVLHMNQYKQWRKFRRKNTRKFRRQWKELVKRVTERNAATKVQSVTRDFLQRTKASAYAQVAANASKDAVTAALGAMDAWNQARQATRRKATCLGWLFRGW